MYRMRERRAASEEMVDGCSSIYGDPLVSVPANMGAEANSAPGIVDTQMEVNACLFKPTGPSVQGSEEKQMEVETRLSKLRPSFPNSLPKSTPNSTPKT